MAAEKILAVDDDEEARNLITAALTEEGMEVTTLGEGKNVISTLRSTPFDLVILDLMLPDTDGFELLKIIRKSWPSLPVIIVSGKRGEDKKAIGFELEVDDYVTKPYSVIELTARIRRHIRRSEAAAPMRSVSPDELCSGDLRLDLKTCLLYKKDQRIVLPARIFRILKFFMENQGQVFSKEQLYAKCWDDNYFDENTIHVYISKVRQFIEDTPNNPAYLKTVIGLGYRFDNRTAG